MTNTEMLTEICVQFRRTADLIEKFVSQTEKTVNSDEAEGEAFFQGELTDTSNSVYTDGGTGSGNFGHEGVEGQIGGSAPSDNQATKSDNHIKMKRPTAEERAAAFSDQDGIFEELYDKYMPKISEAEETGDKDTVAKLRNEWDKENYTRRSAALKRLGTYMEDGYYVAERDLNDPTAEVFRPTGVNKEMGCHDVKSMLGSRGMAAFDVSDSWVKLSESEAKEKVLNFAQKFGDQTFGGLSGNDERIIKTYTYAPAVSSAMRKGQKTEQGDKLKDIMDRTASPERTVYRGITGDFASKISKLKVGDTFSDKGFMSTSNDKEVANTFAGESGVTMTINVPSGYGKSMSISSYSMKPEEAEVLLNAGSTLKIKSIKGKEIECDVIENNTDGGTGSVGVIVVNNGRILTGIRKGDTGSGLICGPGGHIENGETPEQAAIRETHEEFGITPKELILIGRGPVETDTGLSPHIFLCIEYEGEIKCEDGEISEPRFLSHLEIDNVRDILFKPFADSVLLLFKTLFVDEVNSDGGPGSGNHGHKGVPGQIGGSSPSIGGDDEKGLTPKELVEHRMQKGGFSVEQLTSIRKLFDRHTAGSDNQKKADAEITKHIFDGDEIGKALEYKATLEEIDWELKRQENEKRDMQIYKNSIEYVEKEMQPGGFYSGHTKEELIEFGVYPEELEFKEPKFYRKGGMEKDVLSFSTNKNGAGMAFLTNESEEEGHIGHNVSFTLKQMKDMGYRPIAGIQSGDVGMPGEAEVLFAKFPQS